MKKIIKILSAAVILTSVSVITSCGDSDDDNNPGPTTTSNLGDFNFSCDDNGGETNTVQQTPKQVTFTPKQECVQQTGPNQTTQVLQFQDSKVSDFDVQLDCSSRVVRVRHIGTDEEEQTLPIRTDGTVRGTLNFNRQLQNDGKGNNLCWIGYVVTFDGRAQCETETTDTTNGAAQKSLSLTTTVEFEKTTAEQLEIEGLLNQAGEAGSDPTPSATAASPSPSPSASPSASPTASPSASPTASPSPSASPSATPAPSPSVTPVQICIVDNPCSIVGQTDLSC